MDGYVVASGQPQYSDIRAARIGVAVTSALVRLPHEPDDHGSREHDEEQCLESDNGYQSDGHEQQHWNSHDYHGKQRAKREQTEKGSEHGGSSRKGMMYIRTPQIPVSSCKPDVALRYTLYHLSNADFGMANTGIKSPWATCAFRIFAPAA
jgi:hypothetical protein